MLVRMLDDLRQRCAAAGFDLLAPFDVAAFNDGATPEEVLPDHGRGHALAVVVGNSRRLWPAFLEACRRDPAIAARPGPLDGYTVATLTAAAEATGVPFVALWAHTMRPRPIPIQRIAEAAGLARISPSNLSVRPELGPWLALRAVLVLDAPPPPVPAPLPHPCEGCPRPCMDALARALAASGAAPALNEETWRRWLEVRDACPLGRDARYPEEQILYHYARRGLAEAVEKG
jgi:methylmalonic aciduria homocystinuria type C protein